MKIKNSGFIQLLFIFVFLNTGLEVDLVAQNSGSLFMLPDNFYAQMMNPSYMRNDEAIEIAIPGFAGFSFGNSASFKISDLITVDEPGKPVIDLEHFYETGNQNNFIRENLSIPLLFFSTPVKNGRLSFYYKENIKANFKFEMDAVEFFVNGNIDSEYRNFSSGEIKMFGNGYREFAFGYAHRLNKKFNVGGHFKLLFGSAFIELDNWEYGILTSETGDVLTLLSEGQGDMSIPVPIELSENSRILKVNGDGAVSKYFGSYKNPGIAIDLGATYNLNEANLFSFSIVNLGGVWFNYNTVDISQNEELNFPGFNLTNAVRYPEDGYVNPVTLFLDTKEEIRDVYRPVADTAKNFKGISPATTLHYTYKLSDKFWFGLTNQSSFRKNFFWNTLTMTAMQNFANFSVFENINLIGSNSLTLGGGVQYEGKHVQVFAAASNLPAFYHPANNKSYSFMLGMCFLLNNEKNTGSGKSKNKGIKKSKGKISPYFPFYRELNK